ncbi:T9SS type A sorting domain-containing protein [Flammeovirga sp. MY04]|uniref:glycoside hydrolase family 11 protein n=1 Tax=Flammeovirga sp. MY04 TaxID=1191459 RepID=UPI0013051EA3|nr:glycoside hydrolase family 11 protein [Flammeovirga sp. MY04]ANQ52231.2 T9SS type A sorting domain-containing protein [Flammeovirga sp. MY04]
MKNLLYMKTLDSLSGIQNNNQLMQRFYKSVFVMSVFLFSTFDVQSQTICNNQIGNQGGYTYEYWKDSGNGCMTLNNGGNFYVSWSNIGNLLARKGKRPGVKNQTVTYGANYQPSGNSYLCIYGWTTSPLVEYYIVESWGSWRPPGANAKGSVTTDGGTYDIYETTRVQQPSIQGTKTFQQYWSVRRSKRTSGTVTCANHFNAWASLGMNMGNLYEVSFTVEGYQSSGTCDVYSMSMGTSNGNSGGGNTGSNSIKVRAKGVSGQEKLNVRIGNQTIQTLSLTTNFKIFTVNTNSNGDLNLEYFNDQNGRDAQVDWVEINGNRKQAEQQSYNTAVWQNNSCGGQYSEWMHCNGVLGFGNTSGARMMNVDAVDISDNSIYPNPITNGKVSIRNADLGEIHQIVIYDQQGAISKSWEVNDGQALMNLELDLPKGIYIMHVVGSIKSLQKKIIISN